MERFEKYLIYSLTDRGLFSELSNMYLAMLYARKINRKLILNTRQWKARINLGWEDYFKNTIACSNALMTAQSSIFGYNWKHPVFTSRKIFFDISNYLVAKFFDIEFSSDAYRRLQGCDLNDLLGNHWIEDLSEVVRNTFVLNDKVDKTVQKMKDDICLPHDYIGVHVRRGDKITTHEMENLDLNNYINEIKKRKDICSDIYIATDDISIIPFFQKELAENGFHVFYNKNVEGDGYDQKRFNSANDDFKFRMTLETIIDMEILRHSSYFIGTYSSNLSRFIPLFIGFEKCKSLDVQEWNIRF